MVCDDAQSVFDASLVTSQKASENWKQKLFKCIENDPKNGLQSFIEEMERLHLRTGDPEWARLILETKSFAAVVFAQWT